MMGFESYEQFPYLVHMKQEPEDKFTCTKNNFVMSRNAMNNVCFNKKSCGDCIRRKEK